jgi:hypothetical protein
MNIVEIVVPVQSSSVGNIVERSGGRITIRELPGVNTMATLLYQGNLYTLSEAYQPLAGFRRTITSLPLHVAKFACNARAISTPMSPRFSFPLKKKTPTDRAFHT